MEKEKEHFKDEGLIHAVINDNFKDCLYFEYDELFSYGWEALMAARKNYDPSAGTKFSYYAYRGIKQSLIGRITKKKEKFNKDYNTLSLNYEYEDKYEKNNEELLYFIDSGDKSAIDRIIEEQDLEFLISTIKKKIISGTKKGVTRNNILELLDLYKERLENNLSCDINIIYDLFYKEKFTKTWLYEIRKRLQKFTINAIKEIKKEELLWEKL